MKLRLSNVNYLLKNIVKQAMQQEFEFVTFRLEEITQYFTAFLPKSSIKLDVSQLTSCE